MGRSDKKAKSSSALPLTPLLYINDPQLDTPNIHAIAAVIPSVKITLANAHASAISDHYRTPTAKETILIIADNFSNEENKFKLDLSTQCKSTAIKQGCNFASVNLHLHSPTPSDELKKWGTNHLDLNIAQLTPEEVADQVYQWLFTVLSVRETLHLIPPSQMLETDTRNFPHYAYCPISESRLRHKDERIQFVALITSKPTVTPGGKKSGEGAKLTWSVADRTGTANFYFLHRGASSQPTWDWVLALKPGDRKALPRMPCVAVTESIPTRVLKAPVRLIGATVSGTGTVIHGLGKGIMKAGKKMKLGKAKTWIPEADVVFDGSGKPHRKNKEDRRVARADAKDRVNTEKQMCDDTAGYSQKQKKREIRVFDEKGRKLWDDDDSDASTENGSVINEKL